MKQLFCLSLCLIGTLCASAGADESVERWGAFEWSAQGPTEGNPFLDVEVGAVFSLGEKRTEVEGFYDGKGVYRVRFMPDTEGDWTFKTRSNVPALDGKTGSFRCTPPSKGNHGPVVVRNTFHFAYADGSPFFPFGTTCYAWTHQGDPLEEQTFETLKTAPFNKIRMCVFPKSYAWNENEPVYYPYEGTPPKTWDFARFNPEFFRHLEKRIGQLRDLGIEADLIIFHPYDKGHWGFDAMPAEANDRFLRYLVSRLSAYRNVWWSLANEYDFVQSKQESDWDHYFEIVQKKDPYGHLRSIHNGTLVYNHTHPWVTHASIQNGSAVADFGRAVLLRDAYRKPIVYDEVKYEGNIDRRWGNISAEEMVHRFWQGIIAGTYVTHGETYLDPKDILWWSKGGVLHGQSPARIAFLRKIVEAGPAEGMEPIDKWQEEHLAGKRGEYYLYYFGKEAPTRWTIELPRKPKDLPAGTKFKTEVIDTWNMTITPVKDLVEMEPKDAYAFSGKNLKEIELPGKPYMAIRMVRTEQKP